MPRKKPSPDTLQSIADYLRRIAYSLESLQDSFSHFIIAQYGTDEDWAKLAAHYRNQFEALQKGS